MSETKREGFTLIVTPARSGHYNYVFVIDGGRAGGLARAYYSGAERTLDGVFNYVTSVLSKRAKGG